MRDQVLLAVTFILSSLNISHLSEMKQEWFLASEDISYQSTCLSRRGDLSSCWWVVQCDGFTEADPHKRLGVNKQRSYWLAGMWEGEDYS